MKYWRWLCTPSPSPASSFGFIAELASSLQECNCGEESHICDDPSGSELRCTSCGGWVLWEMERLLEWDVDGAEMGG